MKSRQIALMVMLVVTLLLAACQEEKARKFIDTQPIGHGLEFLGMMGVLAALIVVLGRLASESEVMRWKYVPHVMVGLLILLAFVVVSAAVPALLIPFSVAIVLAVALAFAWHHWK